MKSAIYSKSNRNPSPAKILPEPYAFAGFGEMYRGNSNSIFLTKILG